MRMTFLMLPVVLILFLLPMALIILLQVWLCKKSKWLGLILPVLSLMMALLMTLSMSTYTSVYGGASVQVTDGYGNVIREEVTPRVEVSSVDLARVGAVFAVTNIPTAVYGGIWVYWNKRRTEYDDLKKMSIEDLE